MNNAEQDLLCRQYTLGQVMGCQRAGGTRNCSFILRTTTGEWFVRQRYPGYCAPDRIAFDHAAIEFLSRQGVTVVPPRRTVDGRSFFECEDAVWEVFPLIRGRQLREGDAGDVAALARALARFHRAGRAFASRYEKLGLRGETDPRELERIAAAIAAQSIDYSEILRPYRDWLTSASSELSDIAFAALPLTLVHGDIQPANVLIDHGKVAAFVDLDWCAWRPRIYDLAFAILLCCATHESPIRGEDIWSLTQTPQIRPDLVRSFLDGCGDEGLPLTPQERAALRPQIILSWCHCRLAGAMKVDPNQRREFLARPPHDLHALFPGPQT